MESKVFPLFDRFPALAALPRVSLGVFPSPVERVVLDGRAGGRAASEEVALWLKRDDRNAPVAAGNKVRALEFLLGRVGPGDVVATAGADGSTHVYATAVHAARLGARAAAVRWPQEMHPVADAVAREAERRCVSVRRAATVASGLLGAALWRIGRRPRHGGRTHYVPIGASTPLGVLGHVNAGLELGLQIEAGDLPPPAHVVVPLGSGGTVAGLALGLGLAGVPTTLVAVRVAPRVVANRVRVQHLIRGTRRLIRRVARAATSLPAVPVIVQHEMYGGAYGRPLAAGASAGAHFRLAMARPGRDPVTFDATYSAKAAAAAVALAARPRPPSGAVRSDDVLLWVTFDARALPIAGALADAPEREGR